jgi:hypothetical protein
MDEKNHSTMKSIKKTILTTAQKICELQLVKQLCTRIWIICSGS